MKGPLGLRTLFSPVTALLVLTACSGFALEAAPPAAPASSAAPASPAQELVTLDQSVAAARATAPGLKLATVTLDTARAQLMQVQATNGFSLAGKGGYTHQGNLPGTTSSSSTAASTAAVGSVVNGENIQGGLSLAGPATSVGLTAQHSIEDAAPNDQVSSISLSASQTVFDGYPGGRALAAVQQADYTNRVAQVAYDASLKSVVYQDPGPTLIY